MPLNYMAMGFYNLCNTQNLSADNVNAVNEIRKAIQNNPTEYAGVDRIATLFIQDNPDCIFKAGAEGVGCFGGNGFGCSFKIDCGDEGSMFAFIASHIAELLGCKTERLKRFTDNNIYNCNNAVVGQRRFCIRT